MLGRRVATLGKVCWERLVVSLRFSAVSHYCVEVERGGIVDFGAQVPEGRGGGVLAWESQLLWQRAVLILLPEGAGVKGPEVNLKHSTQVVGRLLKKQVNRSVTKTIRCWVWGVFCFCFWLEAPWCWSERLNVYFWKGWRGGFGAALGRNDSERGPADDWGYQGKLWVERDGQSVSERSRARSSSNVRCSALHIWRTYLPQLHSQLVQVVQV